MKKEQRSEAGRPARRPVLIQRRQATRDVDWSALPPATPPSIRTLLRHCLQKNPLERLRDIDDARLAIRDATIPADEAQPIARPPYASTTLPWAVAAIAIVFAIASGVALWRRPAPPVADQRFVIAPPTPGERLSDPLVSPDGSFVVFKGNQLYVRRLSDFEPRPIRGTTDAAMPFLSPDGRWVGFFADGKLKKVQLAGGDPVILCDADSDTPGATWGLDGRILFTSVWSDGALMAVPADGGVATPISTIDKGRRERSQWTSSMA